MRSNAEVVENRLEGMAMQYYCATLDDSQDYGALITPSDPSSKRFDPYILRQGHRLTYVEPLRLDSGPPRFHPDWMWTVDMVPVVTRRVRELLLRLAAADCEFIPVRVGRELAARFWVLNVIALWDCVDPGREKTSVTLLRPAPGVVGVHAWAVDPNAPGSAQIFRPLRMLSTLLVNDPIRMAMVEAGVTGVSFLEA